MVDDSETFDFGRETIRGVERWNADFGSPADFVTVADEGEWEFRGDSLYIDTTGDGGATCLHPREFPDDVVIEYRVTIPAFRRSAVPGDDDFNGRNVNCLFAATGPDGDPSAVADHYRTKGADAGYGVLRNYFLTLTFKHTRLRKSPGANLQSELLFGVEYADHTYEVTICKQGSRIAVAVDGSVLHDWIDSDPLGAGCVALVTWSTEAVFDRWAVYDIE